MNRNINIQGEKIGYRLHRRKGTKCLKLSAYADGYLSVSAPARYPLFLINKFLEKHSEWIWKIVQGIGTSYQDDEKQYTAEKEKIRLWLGQKIVELNREYGFRYEKISVRRCRSRWGSCSQRKNLNFNYKIYYLEKDLQDYVIVHELCHLKELNHGRGFWDLVAKTVPDFQERRKKLRKVKI